MTFETANKEILDLFRLAGKVVDEDATDDYRFIPHEDSNMGRAVSILQTICDSQSHSIPDASECTEDIARKEDILSDAEHIFEALEELEANIGKDDFTLEFDGNEYRLINESDIWDIYVEEIKNTVEDCYDLKLDDIPPFIAFSIDWEQTAKNAYADGYGHQFSSYDGSEEEDGGYYIFRTN